MKGMHLSEARQLIPAECHEIERILLAKNPAAVELVRGRLDDKLSRIAWGQAAGEDVTLDFIGYLALLSVAERLHAKTQR